MENKKLIWINYISHHVYTWWFYFFNKYFLFDYYDNNSKDILIWNKKKLLLNKNISVFWNSLRFVNDKNIRINKNDILVIWDIFSLLLVFKYLFRKNTIFYTEIIVRKNDKLLKKIIVIFYRLFFINKKILVPTLESFNIMKKVSKKIFYLPQIFYWDIHKNDSLNDEKLKIIFVWNIPYWAKNLYFLLDTLEELDNENIDFEIWLCWRINEEHLIRVNRYKDKLWKKLNYLWEFWHKELSKEYLKHNLFILPSLSDPIWAVVLEAMAHSLPIIVSENVWAKSYIHENKNWYVYKDKEDLKNKILFFLNNRKRLEFWIKSYELVKENHYYKNEKLINSKKEEFDKFITK